MPFHPSPRSFKCSQYAMAPDATNALSWRGESGYPLARYRAFLKHAKKFSSHDQQSSRHGVWPTCGPNCAAYIAHNFPGTLGLFCRTLRLRGPYEQCKALISAARNRYKSIRFLLLPTAIVRPLSSLARFSFVISKHSVSSGERGPWQDTGMLASPLRVSVAFK
jgi:hypothetical protein